MNVGNFDMQGLMQMLQQMMQQYGSTGQGGVGGSYRQPGMGGGFNRGRQEMGAGIGRPPSMPMQRPPMDAGIGQPPSMPPQGGAMSAPGQAFAGGNQGFNEAGGGQQQSLAQVARPRQFNGAY